MINCINCGAAVEAHIDKCPFCGTSYFDFTNIDFNRAEPVVVQMKYEDYIISFLTKPKLNNISCYPETRTIMSGNTPIAYIEESTTLISDISFEAIANPNKELMTIVKIK